MGEEAQDKAVTSKKNGKIGTWSSCTKALSVNREGCTGQYPNPKAGKIKFWSKERLTWDWGEIQNQRLRPGPVMVHLVPLPTN